MDFTTEMVLNDGHLRSATGVSDFRPAREMGEEEQNLCPKREKEDVCFGQFRESIFFSLSILLDGRTDGRMDGWVDVCAHTLRFCDLKNLHFSIYSCRYV